MVVVDVPLVAVLAGLEAGGLLQALEVHLELGPVDLAGALDGREDGDEVLLDGLAVGVGGGALGGRRVAGRELASHAREEELQVGVDAGPDGDFRAEEGLGFVDLEVEVVGAVGGGRGGGDGEGAEKREESEEL